MPRKGSRRKGAGSGTARRGRGRRSKDMEAVAHERMELLVGEAENAVRAGRGDRARRYVELAQKIGMRHNVPLDRAWKRWVCAGCGTYLVPGLNASLRVRPRRKVVTCKDCGAVKRTATAPPRAKPARRG